MTLNYNKYKNTLSWNTSDREALKAYLREEGRLIDLFWSDICEEYGISPDHPKYSLLSSMAWEHGHSSGFAEVDYWFGELIQLIDL